MTGLFAMDVVALGVKELPHGIDIDQLSQVEKDPVWEITAGRIEEWCAQQFGDCRYRLMVDEPDLVLYETNQQGTWDIIKGHVRFMHERDLMMCKLRWA